MRLQKVQEALNTKKIPFEYTEEDGCGSIDFMFRGLKFHVWEYEDSVWVLRPMCLQPEEVRMWKVITKRSSLGKSCPGRI